MPRSARSRLRQTPDREAQERRRLEVLYDVTRRLAAVPDSEKILDFIVNSAMTLLAADAAGLRFVDGDDLVLKARTESAAEIMARPRLHHGESLSGHVLVTGQPLAAPTRAVRGPSASGEVRPAIRGAGADLPGAPAVAVWVADETRRVLELRAISDDRTAADFPTRTLRFDEGIAGWVASHSRPLDVPDVFRDSRTQAREWFKAHGFTSAHA